MSQAPNERRTLQFRSVSSRLLCLAAASALTIAVPRGMHAQQPSLTIRVDHPTAQVSPRLYGLMTEEINFSYDGGIYPELVRDRTLGGDWQALAHWTMVSYGDSAVKVAVEPHDSPSGAIKRSLKVQVTKAAEGSPA